MNCPICHQEFESGDRAQANVVQTFIFKPADVADTVNPAQVSEAELLESRKEHKRTAIGTVFFDFGVVPVPEGAMNIRHVGCVVQKTGSATNGKHPANKHQIRYERSIHRRQK